MWNALPVWMIRLKRQRCEGCFLLLLLLYERSPGWSDVWRVDDVQDGGGGAGGGDDDEEEAADGIWRQINSSIGRMGG